MKKQQFNQKKMTQRKLGFSLIELSIVILIIGILVLGVTKGSAIMTKAKLGSARALTASSPAAVIPDMIAWYETSLDSSFNSANAFDGTTLTNTGGGSWFDNSPIKNNNATTVTGVITYRENAMNSLPVVRFPGSASNSLAFNSSSLNQKYYTVFVVESRSAATGDLLSLGGAGAANTLGYSATTTLGTATVGSVTIGAYSGATPRISTFVSDTTSKRAYVNGTIGGATGTTGVITATASGLIGMSAAAYTGDIAEIIIYNRGLKVDERNDIQNYLSKKYSIRVTASTS
jgi:prepilin-type N-terminal cleavage/methylation domain-containing protein